MINEHSWVFGLLKLTGKIGLTLSILSLLNLII